MTIKVGDMVRIIENTSASCNKVGDVGEVVELCDSVARVQVDGGGIMANWSELNEITPIPATHTILTTITDRMEQHMAAGQYVQAVGWARVAEMVRELEDE